MAKVNICNVVVKDNPCQFSHPFQFEITFECIEDLNEGEIGRIRRSDFIDITSVNGNRATR